MNPSVSIPAIAPEKTFDLAVIGAGIVGAACAWQAQRAGLRVALLEAGEVGASATGAGMGHWVVIDEDPAELALCRLSMQEWAAWGGLAGQERTRTGTLWLAETPAQQAAALQKAQRLNAADWPAEWLDAAALHQAQPGLAPDLLGALWVPRDEVVYGPGLAAALVREFEAAGGVLLRGFEALDPSVGQGPAGRDEAEAGVVHARDGRSVRTGHRLLATGVAAGRWLAAAGLLGSAGSPVIVPRKGQLAITDRYPGRLHHALVELGYIDSAHGDAGESVAFNLQPRASGQWLLGSSRQFDAPDRTVDMALLGRMVRRAQRFMPGLGDLRVLRCWAGHRPASIDGRPLIGPVNAAWSVAAGHEGLGLTTAMGTARLWLDLLLGRPPAIDPRPYDPRRFAGVDSQRTDAAGLLPEVGQ